MAMQQRERERVSEYVCVCVWEGVCVKYDTGFLQKKNFIISKI